jgi:hypothetical protein
MKMINMALIFTAALMIGFLPMVTQAGAETHIESNVDYRVTIGLHVGDAQLQGWLPGDWNVEQGGR